MNRKELTEKRNTAIYGDFVKQFNSGYRPDVICKKLSDKYFMTAKTIMSIVSKAKPKT